MPAYGVSFFHRDALPLATGFRLFKLMLLRLTQQKLRQIERLLLTAFRSALASRAAGTGE
jgi:hypothetical protein